MIAGILRHYIMMAPGYLIFITADSVLISRFSYLNFCAAVWRFLTRQEMYTQRVLEEDATVKCATPMCISDLLSKVIMI